MTVQEFVHRPLTPPLMSPLGVRASAEANLIAFTVQHDRTMKLQQKALDDNGWPELESYARAIVAEYKLRNGAEKVVPRPDATPQDLLVAAAQFEPVERDQGEIAEARRRIAKIDAALKPLGTSVWTDPRTRRVAQILAGEAGDGMAGYVRSREPSLTEGMSLPVRGAVVAYRGIQAAADELVGVSAEAGQLVGKALTNLGLMQVDGLSGGQGDAFVNAPTNWVQDRDGSWYHNGGKVGSMELLAGIWHQLTGDLIDQEVANFRAVDHYDQMRQRGFEHIATAVSQTIGGLAPFMAIGGAGAAAGRSALSGVTKLATGRALTPEHAGKVVSWLADSAAFAVSTGAYEALSTGRLEGYGATFANGMLVSVPMMALGIAGRGAERLLGERLKMPGSVARPLSGMLEGVGFVGLDRHAMNALWGWLREPNKQDWQTFAEAALVSALAMGAIKGVAGHSPADVYLPPERAAAARRARVAETGETAAAAAAAASVEPQAVGEGSASAGVSRGTFSSLGAAARELKATAGASPGEAQAARERLSGVRSVARLEQAGLEKGDADRRSARIQARQELDELLRQKPEIPEGLSTAENAAARRKFYEERDAKVLELMQKHQLDFGKSGLEAVAEALAGRRQTPRIEIEKPAQDFMEGKEHVPGAPPAPIRPLEGKKPSPEKQMVQEGGREGLEPERFAGEDPAEAARREERRVSELRDPLEDPRFAELPQDVRERILAAETPLERKQIFAGAAPERRGSAAPEATGEAIGALYEEIAANEGRDAADLVRRVHELNYETSDTHRRGDKITIGFVSHPDFEVGIEAARKSGLKVDEKKYGPRRPGFALQWHVTGTAEELGKLIDSMPRHPEMEGEPEIPEARTVPNPSPGEPASLRLRPSGEREGVPGTEPVRESDILLDMEGRAGDPVRTRIGVGVRRPGMTSEKGILGWFHTWHNVVRLGKSMQRSVVAAHEWAHAMQNAVVGFTAKDMMRTLGKNKALAKELLKAAETYPGLDKLPKGAQLAEGWAEFWARHMLDDPQLQSDVPNLHAYLMRWVTDPQQATVLAQMQRIHEGLRRYRDQGAVMRGEQSIRFITDPASKQERLKRGNVVGNFLHEMNKALVDDVAGLKKSLTEAFAREHGKRAAEMVLASMPITENPARLVDTFRMTATPITERFLKVGTTHFDGTSSGESIADIFKGIDTLQDYKDLFNYTKAKIELEMATKGRPTQLDRFDNEAIVDKLYTRDRDDRAMRIKAYFDRVIDYAVEAGGFTPERAQRIKESSEYYVPFLRAVEGPKQHGQGRGVAERGTGVGYRSGSQHEILDPMQSIAEVTQSIVMKAQQANVMKAMWKLSLQHEGMGSLVFQVARDKIPENHALATIAMRLRAEGKKGGKPDQVALADLIEEMVVNGQIDPFVTMFTERAIPKGSRPIVAYTPSLTEAELDALPKRAQAEARAANGKLIWLELDVDAYNTLMGLDWPHSFLDQLPPMLSAALQLPSKMAKIGITGAAPAFAVKNSVRDIQSYNLYSKDGSAMPLQAVAEFVRGAAEMHRHGTDYEIFRALGGEGLSLFSTEFREKKVPVDVMPKEGLNVRRKLYKAFHAYLNFMSKPEQFLRVREFQKIRQKALAEGKGELEANLLGFEAGRELMNFTRMGSLIRGLTRIIPYTGAGIAGSRKFYGTVLGKFGKEAQRAAIVRGLTTLTMMSALEQLLFGDEDWHKELPQWQKLGYWNLRLPFTDEPVALPKPFEPGILFTAPFDMVVERAMDRNPIEAKTFLWEMTSNLFNRFDVMPTAVKPLIENYLNKDLFTGREIVPSYLAENRLPKDQFTAYTTHAARSLGAMLGISPAKIEHLVQGYTGRLWLDMIRSGEEIAGLRESRGSWIESVPGAGTLFRQQPFEHARSVQDVYDLSLEMNQRAGSGELSLKDRTSRRLLNRAKDQISGLRAQVRAGKLSAADADRRAAELAQRVLARVRQ